MAKELFFKHGTKRITIEEICKTANTSKVTFYKYFNNKVDLVKYIRDEMMKEGFDQYDKICELDIPYRKS